MFEAIDLICGCCELCLWVGSLGEKKAKAEDGALRAEPSRLVRLAREEKRGVRLTFAKKRVSEIEFLAGLAAGKRASELSDMELKRLALAMPHRTARFAIRRYLIHRKQASLSAPSEPVIRR